jgi:hypothetical protein
MSDLFAQTRNSTLVIGLGRLGARVAAAGAAHGECGSATWAAIHTDAAELIATGLIRKVLLHLPETSLAAATVYAELFNNEAEITNLASGFSSIILVGSAADGGSILMPACSAVFEKVLPATPLIAIAGDSTALEPSLQGSRFDRLVNALEDTCDLVIPLNSAILRCGLTADSPITSVDTVAAKKMLACAQALTGAMMRDDRNSRFTLPGLKNVLRSGVAALGLGTASGSNAPLLAAESATRRIAADPIRFSGVAVALICGRVLSVVEAHALLEVLQSELKADQPVLLGLATEEHLDDEAICLIIASSPSSANVIKLESATMRSV